MTGPVPARRRPWLLPLLVIGFIALSVAEVWLITGVAGAIGPLPTVLILFAEAVLGVWLMRREGRRAWQALVDAYTTGRMPSGQLADAALVLAGGVMLILPGFFTDLIGLALLLPWTRPLARRAGGLLIARQAARSGVDLRDPRSRFDTGTVVAGEAVDEPSTRPPGDGTVISGEIED